jgi:hypothetical protein
MKTFNIIFLLLISTLSVWGQAPKDETHQQSAKKELITDAPDRKAVKGFGGHLIVIKNPTEFVKEWLKPETPKFNSAKIVKPNESLGIIVLFAGCKPNSDGVCNTEVDYTIYKPDGKIYFERKGLELWKNVAPPKANIQLGKAILQFKMQESNLAGEYKIKAKVYDKNADISFELETQFTLETN